MLISLATKYSGRKWFISIAVRDQGNNYYNNETYVGECTDVLIVGQVDHSLLSQLELAVGNLAVLALVLALVTEQLTAGVQHVRAAVAHTVDVIAHLRKAAVGEPADVGL